MKLVDIDEIFMVFVLFVIFGFNNVVPNPKELRKIGPVHIESCKDLSIKGNTL